MEKRAIIMEGSDGVGKSTLGKLLATRLQIPYLNFGRPSDKKDINIYIQNHTNIAEQMMLCTHQKFILDRLYLSNLVYDDIYKRGKGFEYVDQMKNIKDKVVFVLVEANYPTIIERLHRRRSKVEDILLEQMKLFTTYADLLEKLGIIDVVRVNTSKLTADECSAELAEKLRKYGF